MKINSNQMQSYSLLFENDFHCDNFSKVKKVKNVRASLLEALAFFASLENRY